MLKTILMASVVCLALASSVNAKRANSDIVYIKVLEKKPDLKCLNAEKKYHNDEIEKLKKRLDSNKRSLDIAKRRIKELEKSK